MPIQWRRIWLRSNGRRPALGVAVLALGTLVVTTILAKDVLRERWYLHKVGSDSITEAGEAAMELGRLRSVRAVRPVLEAMNRFTVERGRIPELVLVGPAEALGSPERAPPPSYEQFSFLKFFQQLDDLAVPGLLEAMTEEDETVARFAATILDYRNRAGDNHEVWFHIARFRQIVDVTSALEDLQHDETQSAEARRSAAAILRRIGGR